ncbi:MAG: hypothetical protein H0W25_09545 [Acidimicrobiia bacterium]|nr:hypothetical protein [Acidimicrobiia bacterium]
MKAVTRAEQAGLVAITALLLLPLRGLLRNQGPPMEEGFMLVFPERLLNGDLPNRDYLHLYGPGSVWVLAVLYEVFGVELHVQRLAGYAQQIGVVLGVFAVARPFGPVLATAGAVIALIIIVPPIGLTALAWVGAVALALWALRLGLQAVVAHRDGDDGAAGRRILIAGLLAAAALLYRPDVIVAVALAGLVVGRRLDPALRRRGLVALAAGLTPYLLHLGLAGPGNVVHGMLIEPVFELRGGRRLPLPPSWDQFDGFLQRAGALHEPPWPFPAPPGPAQLTIWLVLLLASMAALIVTGRRWVRDEPTSPAALALLGTGALAVGLLPQALQRTDTTHLAWVSCVPFGFLPALAGRGLRGRPRAPLLAAAAALAIPFFLVPHFTFRSYGDYAAQTFGRHRLAFPIEHEGRLFYYGRPDVADAAHALLADVERLTEPGDRMLVGSGDLRFTPYSDAYLYYLLPDRPPATRYIEMDPGVANGPDSGLAEEVAAADLVVLSRVWDDWDEPNDSRVAGPDEPNQVLRDRFCEAGDYGGLYVLYLRCG